jgi:hypothetical protein
MLLLKMMILLMLVILRLVVVLGKRLAVVLGKRLAVFMTLVIVDLVKVPFLIHPCFILMLMRLVVRLEVD